MREGRLLAESSPTALLQEYRANSLEGVFLALCQVPINIYIEVPMYIYVTANIDNQLV